jgi:hypothetical protein
MLLRKSPALIPRWFSAISAEGVAFAWWKNRFADCFHRIHVAGIALLFLPHDPALSPNTISATGRLSGVPWLLFISYRMGEAG